MAYTPTTTTQTAPLTLAALATTVQTTPSAVQTTPTPTPTPQPTIVPREHGITISFSEIAKGWTSFKSFVQDDGLSLNNDYYTLKNGELWIHHFNETRNNFYDDQYNSHVDILFNEESATVKSFASMKYEGSQAKITQNLGDKEYYNNENTSTISGFLGKQGWYVESGITDLQSAGEMEFKDKEGKWFSYMKGVPVETVADLNSKEFSFQGIDMLDSSSIVAPISGCMDPNAVNYDPNANIDDGSCTYTPPISGCMDSTAINYNPNATVDDGSCTYPPPISGCTDPNAINYDPTATVDDLSCIVCANININYTVEPHPMFHGLNGIHVMIATTAEDTPYTVTCTNSVGVTIGGMSFGPGGSSSNVRYFGQGSSLPTDEYTITITTASGCTSQQTIFLDNGI